MALELGNQVKFASMKQRSPAVGTSGSQERGKSSGDVLGNAKQHQSKYKLPAVSNPDKGVDRTANRTGSSGDNPFKYTK